MTQVDKETPQFCQAQDPVLFIDKTNTPEISFHETPSEGINQISFKTPQSTIPSSYWSFKDPCNENKLYVAIFPHAALPNKEKVDADADADDSFKSILNGRLYHFNKTPDDQNSINENQEMESNLATDASAVMICAGNKGKCNGVFGFVKFSK